MSLSIQTALSMRLAGLVLLAAALPQVPAAAQEPPTGEPFSAFSTESDEPIQIEADELEVFDRERRAVFTGNVEVVQGTVNLKASTLTVFYEGEDGTEAAGAAAGGQQQVRRIEAEGQVVVTSEDQRATGESAVYETETEIVTLTGNVVLSQGDNVVRGDRLIVNLATGQSRVEASGGRVQGLFAPRRDPDAQ